MHTISKIFISLSLVFLLFSCKTEEKQIEIIVSNPGDDLRNELISLELGSLGIDAAAMNYLLVKNAESNEAMISQLYDRDADGSMDDILIYCEVEANSDMKMVITETDNMPDYDSKLFCRFVPERTDDFAWENDRVAFRTYGPTAQKMAEDGDKAGTLSSGMDCWLKKVDYPIINKWYEKTTSGKGSYHKDTGEGLDNFHVGISRGCGGLGVYIDEEIYASKNFTAWEILDNGPLQTRFRLDYADWETPNGMISETKEISLDRGSNLMKIVAEVEGSDQITVGLTLHENDGEIAVDTLNRWFSYWQPHDDSEIGMGIICHPEYYDSYSHQVSEEKDKSHLFVHLKVIDGKVEYYTGFGWKKSERFSTSQEWNDYLNRSSLAIQHPLEVKILEIQ